MYFSIYCSAGKRLLSKVVRLVLMCLFFFFFSNFDTANEVHCAHMSFHMPSWARRMRAHKETKEEQLFTVATETFFSSGDSRL